jgi:L-alanine-DL-glutamate epimerase-like enolase superfamily enzyme
MRVRAVRVDQLEIPFRVPFESADMTWRSRRLAILHLVGDDLEGLGEIALEAPGGLPVPIPPGLLEVLVGVDVASPVALDRALVAIENGWTLGRAARSGAESAALDLAAQAAGTSLRSRLAGHARDRVWLNGLVGVDTPSAAAKAAKGLVKMGFRCLKLKAGGDTVELVAAVRSAIGPEVGLRLDANGTWPERYAVQLIGELESFGLEYVEQPIPPSLGPAALARVRRAVDVPIAADESVTDPAAAAELMLAGAVDVLVIKPSRVGGPRQARRIVELATDLGVGVIVSTLFETGIGLSAALQVAATVPDREAAHGLATSGMLASDLLVDGPVAEGGALNLTGGPGLGVQLDPEAVRAHLVG